MNELDVAILVIAVLGAIHGVYKGFIVSIASLIALILGYYLSIRFAWFFEKLLSDATGNSSILIYLLSFVICFSLVVIGVHFLGKLIQRVIELTPLGCINRILGALFGILKGLILISAIIYVIELTDRNNKMIQLSEKEASTFYYPIGKLLPSLIPFAKNIRNKEEKATI